MDLVEVRFGFPQALKSMRLKVVIRSDLGLRLDVKPVWWMISPRQQLNEMCGFELKSVYVEGLLNERGIVLGQVI